MLLKQQKSIGRSLNLVLFILTLSALTSCSSGPKTSHKVTAFSTDLKTNFSTDSKDKSVGQLKLTQINSGRSILISNVLSPDLLPRYRKIAEKYRHDRKTNVSEYVIHQKDPNTGKVYAGVFKLSGKPWPQQETPKVVSADVRIRPTMTRNNFSKQENRKFFTTWFEIIDSNRGYISPLPNDRMGEVKSASSLENFNGLLPIDAFGKPPVVPESKNSKHPEITKAFTSTVPLNMGLGFFAYSWQTPEGERWGFYIKQTPSYDEIAITEKLATYKSFRVLPIEWPDIEKNWEIINSPYFSKMKIGHYTYFRLSQSTLKRGRVWIAHREDGKYDIITKDPAGAAPLILETIDKDDHPQTQKLAEQLKQQHLDEFITTKAEIAKMKAQALPRHHEFLGKCFVEALNKHPKAGLSGTHTYSQLIAYSRKNCDAHSHNWMVTSFASSSIKAPFLTDGELQSVVSYSKYKPAVIGGQKEIRNRAYKKTDKYKREQYYQALARKKAEQERQNRKTRWTYQTFTGATYTDAVTARYKKAVRSAKEYTRKWKNEQEWIRFIQDSRK